MERGLCPSQGGHQGLNTNDPGEEGSSLNGGDYSKYFSNQLKQF